MRGTWTAIWVLVALAWAAPAAAKPNAQPKVVSAWSNTGEGRAVSVVIKGRVLGTAATDDHYGFVSEQIVKISIAGSKLPLTTGKDPSLLLAPLTNDARIHEV